MIEQHFSRDPRHETKPMTKDTDGILHFASLYLQFGQDHTLSWRFQSLVQRLLWVVWNEHHESPCPTSATHIGASGRIH